MWLLCGMLYAMQLPFLVITILVAVAPGLPDAVTAGLFIASAGLCVAVIALCIANLVLAVTRSSQEYRPCGTTMAVKLALMPFFVINFVLCGIYCLGTLALPLIAFAPPVWGVSLVTTYIYMLGNGVQNIAYLVRRFFATRKVRYAVYAALHFIYIADVAASVLAYIDSKDELAARPAEAL